MLKASSSSTTAPASARNAGCGRWPSPGRHPRTPVPPASCASTASGSSPLAWRCRSPAPHGCPCHGGHNPGSARPGPHVHEHPQHQPIPHGGLARAAQGQVPTTIAGNSGRWRRSRPRSRPHDAHGAPARYSSANGPRRIRRQVVTFRLQPSSQRCGYGTSRNSSRGVRPARAGT